MALPPLPRSPTRRIKTSIRTRILALAVGASLLASVTFISVMAVIRESAFREGIRQKTEMESDHLANTLVTPLWIYIDEACDQIILSELMDADFSAIFLRGPTGSLISAFGRPAGLPDPARLGAGDEAAFAETALARGERLIVRGKQEIGRVTLYAAGTVMRADSRQRLLEQAIMAALEGAFVAFLLFVTIDRVISRRVVRMGREFAAFSEKSLDVRATDNHSDEIGDLAASFNGMAGLIQNYARGLEAAVEERTRELGLANAELHNTNAELSDSLARLASTQDKLIETRRIASIGQLVASIAHQLNTPLGAIISANHSLSEEIHERIGNIARRLARMDEVDVAVLEEFLAESGASEFSEFSGLRQKKREIQTALAARGIADAADIADKVVEANLFGLGSRLFEFMDLERARDILSVVESVSIIRKSGAIIASASERAAHVIRTLRIYLGQAPAETPLQLAVASEIDTILSFFGAVAHGELDLVTHFDHKVKVLGKRDQLDLVWMNLIDNAIQSMQGRGRLELVVERKEGLALVTVADSGPGVPPESQPHLFEAFFTTKPQGAGIGLGLNSAKRIIEEHGGTISFTSRPGRTVFTVTLKAIEEPGPAS